LIVGIDVHKRSHAVALIDDRGGQVAAVTVANSPKGYRRLIDWLVEHDAASAVIGVESPGSYGRCLVAALGGAGFEVLQVPAWRTHRERHRRGPGKTDPGDALSIAHVVLSAIRSANEARRAGRTSPDRLRRSGPGLAAAATAIRGGVRHPVRAPVADRLVAVMSHQLVRLVVSERRDFGGVREPDPAPGSTTQIDCAAFSRAAARKSSALTLSQPGR
jgi:transposase